MFVTALAWGGACRWPEIESATATMGEVAINGETVAVRGPKQWLELQADLQSCGRFRAAKELERCATRQGVNVAILLTAPRSAPAARRAALRDHAGERRETLQGALRDEG
jgi:hypothetical protein